MNNREGYRRKKREKDRKSEIVSCLVKPDPSSMRLPPPPPSGPRVFSHNLKEISVHLTIGNLRIRIQKGGVHHGSAWIFFEAQVQSYDKNSHKCCRIKETISMIKFFLWLLLQQVWIQFNSKWRIQMYFKMYSNAFSVVLWRICLVHLSLI